MVSPDLWLEVLSWVKTLFDLAKSTIDLVDLERTHQKYRHDPETIREARRVSVQFQTFSEAEVESLLKRIQGCRDRFVAQAVGLIARAAFAASLTKRATAMAVSCR